MIWPIEGAVRVHGALRVLSPGCVGALAHGTTHNTPTPSVDVFFLDWEKPRRVLAKGGGREEAAPVSCWRTLLVANEWNELQVCVCGWGRRKL